MEIVIEKVETALVPPRWGLLKVSTNQGIIGWGDIRMELADGTITNW